MTIQHSENQPLIKKAILKIHTALYPKQRQSFFTEDPEIVHNGQKYRLASFNKRIFASGLDLIIASIITIPIGSSIASFTNGEKLNRMAMHPEWMINDISVWDMLGVLWESGILLNMALIQLFTLFLIGIYMVFFWVKKGATLGKMPFRCKVVDAESLENISLKQGIIRFIMLPFSILPLLMGLLMINWNNQRQALHDKVAKTLVIYQEKVKKS